MEKSSKKILTFPLRLALIILLYGGLFKVMHWPYAQTLMLIGSTSIVVLYSIRFIYKKEKVRLDYVKLGLVLLWTTNYYLKAFHILNVPYIFEIVLLALFIWWFSEEGLTYFSRRKLKGKQLLKAMYYLFLGTSIACIVLGITFKIQHWPFGNILFTFGVLLSSIMLIVDYFVIKKQ